jgi:hypothetical protein
MGKLVMLLMLLVTEVGGEPLHGGWRITPVNIATGPRFPIWMPLSIRIDALDLASQTQLDTVLKRRGSQNGKGFPEPVANTQTTSPSRLSLASTT